MPSPKTAQIPNPSPRLHALAKSLLQDPFAVDHRLTELSLVEIGEWLETYDEDRDPSADANPETVSRTFCQMLMEVEAIQAFVLLSVPLREWPEAQSPAAPRAGNTRWIEMRSRLSTPHAGEYLALASYIEGSAGTPDFPFGPRVAGRMRGLAICLALEAEAAEKLKPGIQRLWPERDRAVSALLEKDDSDLQPELAEGLDRLARERSDWLYKGTLAIPRFMESLLYFRGFPLQERYLPTLRESGLWLLLFGQDAKIGDFPVRNLMGISPLPSGHLVELAFRLNRADHVRNRLAHAATTLRASDLQLLQDDLDACSRLLVEVTCG